MEPTGVILFTAPCGNGHSSTYRYVPSELRDHLAAGTLQFYCTTCETGRGPTAEEQITLTQAVIRCEVADETRTA